MTTSPTTPKRGRPPSLLPLIRESIARQAPEFFAADVIGDIEDAGPSKDFHGMVNRVRSSFVQLRNQGEISEVSSGLNFLGSRWRRMVGLRKDLATNGGLTARD